MSTPEESKNSTPSMVSEPTKPSSKTIDEYNKSNPLRLDNYKSVVALFVTNIDGYVGENVAKLTKGLGAPTFIYTIGNTEHSTWKLSHKDRTFYIFSGKPGTSYECHEAKRDSIEDEAICLDFIKVKITPVLFEPKGNENGNVKEVSK